jgi:hypothetical protein
MAFIWLKARYNNAYVAAENGGGTTLHANRSLVVGWESFTLHDQNGPYLCNGDAIALQAFNGQFVCADMNLSDKSLVANRSVVNGWERFTVECLDGTPSGAVIDNTNKPDGTLCVLRSHGNGLLVNANQFGDKRLQALGTYIGDWEPFYIGFGGAVAVRPSQGVWTAMPTVV